MNVIRQANPNILNFLGEQHYKEGIKYRVNKYCYVLEQEYYYIIYNTLTGGIITIYPFEWDNKFINIKSDYVQHLYNDYFIVPDNFNEDEIIELYRKKSSREILSNYLDTPDSFTILPTTECNARCTYCYELGIENKHSMSTETANKVADYIINNGSKTRPLVISWFGGEPLYNKEVINLITTKVRSNGFNLSTSMISNGYLFDDKTIYLAKHVWGLNSVQITLDGTESVYNKTKRYIYKDDPNPFKTVINNIHKLIENDIFVSIRLNGGVHNSDNLLELVKFLGEEFKDVKHKMQIYVWEIFTTRARTEEEAQKLFPKLTEIHNLIHESGFNSPQNLEHGIKYIHCMVDAGNGVIIDPSGNLGLCEHYPHTGFLGHVDDPHTKDFEIIKSWRDYVSTNEPICQTCPIRPICLKMRKCTDEFICTKPELDYLLNKINSDLVILDKSFYEEKISQGGCGCKQCHQD